MRLLMEIGAKEWSNLIIKGAADFDIDLDHSHTDQFAAYAAELIKWTKKINITSITDPVEIAAKHFLDSLAPARLIPQGAGLLDIGSGGGFPGIPLKILMPSLSVTLIDASRKKISFLKHVIRILKLENIEALHCRAEKLAVVPRFANSFDIIISRALSDLETFVRLALPLLARNGIIVALKGAVDQQEWNNLRSIVLEQIDIDTLYRGPLSVTLQKYSLPILDSKRSIICVSKPVDGLRKKRLR